MKKGQSSETGNTTGTQDEIKQTKTQHNMCWTESLPHVHV